MFSLLEIPAYQQLIHYYAKFVLLICIVLRPIHQVVMEARMWKSEYSQKCDKAITQCNELLLLQQVLID